ncbi:hypothetical protein G7Y89_g1661 [Cudoniella acicularis]|uniref:Heterokaryon incompatibility domain-containing protein n=1 Tax=Cudoniella acicularis TaxID=354080 RepID=A0A8H4RXS0_9HELO|nr:hypothetical protein G7Y89_g1661 [Cudoniella acicularis]
MSSPQTTKDIGFPRISLNGFIGLIFTFLTISIVVALAQTSLRITRLKKVELDDGFLMLALVALAGACGIMDELGELLYVQIYASLKLVPFPTGPAILRYHRLLQAAAVLEWVAIFAAKFSLLLFFRKLVNRTHVLKIWWAIVLVFLICLAGVCIPLGFMVCSDFSLNFLTIISVREQISTDASVTIDVLSDILVLSIPLAILWTVKVNLRRKMAIGAILCLSVFMIIIAIARVTAAALPSGLSDTVWLFFWQTMEAAVAVIMVSLTGLRSLFVQDASQGASKRVATYPSENSGVYSDGHMAIPYDKPSAKSGIMPRVQKLMGHAALSPGPLTDLDLDQPTSRTLRDLQELQMTTATEDAKHDEASVGATPLERSPIYRSLDNQTSQIRLITLHASPDFDSPIECSLGHVNLDEKLEYQALSYVWGNPNACEDIFIDGTTLPATTNLVAALRQIRDATKPLVLWVDAICINQNDVNERNHQVQLMALIYKSASIVFSWLGLAADDSDLAIEYIGQMAEEIRKQVKGYLVMNGDYLPMVDPSDDGTSWVKRVSEYFHARDLEHHALSALEKFLDRPYWKRLWVLQEMVLATELVFLCGSQRLGWEKLDLVTSEVQAFSNLSLSTTKMRFMAQHWGPAIAKATDPRDFIYGISAIIDLGIPVDYSLSTYVVFREAAMKLVLRRKPALFLLIVFSGIGCRRPSFRSSSTPCLSWVPDLAAPNLEPLQGPWYCLDKYRCSGKSELSFHVSPDQGFLRIKGIIWDRVAIYLPKFESSSSQDNPARLLQRLTSEYGENPYPSGMPILQVLFRLFLLDFEYGGRSSRLDISTSSFLDLASGFITLVLFWEGYRLYPFPEEFDDGEIKTPLDRTRIMREFWGGTLEPHQEDHFWRLIGIFSQRITATVTWAEICLRSTTYFHNTRYIFQTSNGYLGLGPPLMQEDDLICILSGCSVPFILRREGSHYLLVGPCFVMGIMDGEAVLDLKAFENSLKTFEIH